MKTLIKTIGPQALVATLPWWYYEVRIGWLGMNYEDQISMRWVDVLLLIALYVSGSVFIKEARTPGAGPVLGFFRVAMLLSLVFTALNAATVILTFALVPHVPAHLPPATPGTWISRVLTQMAPPCLCSGVYYLAATLIHVLTRTRVTGSGAPAKDC